MISAGNLAEGWPINPTTGKLFDTTLQTVYGGASRTVRFIPPTGYIGFDLINANWSKNSGFAWRSSGFSVDGTGQISMSNALFGTTSTGVQIDTPSQRVTAAAVAAGGGGGGSGTNDYYAGDILQDANGGQYEVATVSAGAVTGVTILVPSISSSPPSNPVATFGASGINATLNLTWAARSELSLQPSGGPIKLLALTNAANDGAAASAGVAVGQIYRNGSIIMQRVA
jgi:hypothetical protein